VNSAAAAITGNLATCIGATTALSHPVTGGTWSSSNPAKATVDATTGVVTGISTGSSVITYTISTGCYKTATVNVSNLPPSITGATTVCEGASAAFTCVTGGSGTWSSSNTAIATAGSTTGNVTGTGGGVATITYMATTGCSATRNITVNPAPGNISGSANMCVGASGTLTSATSSGTWTSSNTSVVTIGSVSGAVNAVVSGYSTISYTLSTGCYRTFVVTVVNPPAAITGTALLCVGNTSVLSSTTTGQTWSSSNASVATVDSASSTTGLVTAISTGTTIISYTNSTGCARTLTVTVNAAPSAITGDSILCLGQTITLGDATSGGTWSSSNTAKATIGLSSGIATGVATGTATISYRFGASCFVTRTISVNGTPAAITGTTSICVGETTTLSHTTSGGTWSSSNGAVATVISASGIVTGVGAGSSIITYSISSGCSKTVAVTVKPLPAAITGASSLFVGASTTLASTSTGGTWSSSSTATAAVGSATGVVNGISVGTATITYRITSTTCYVTRSLTVNTSSSKVNATPELSGGTFTLYPNPTSGRITIEATVAGSLSVYTLDGKQVLHYTIEAGTTAIFLNTDLANGVYMCRFDCQDGSSVSVRLVYEH